MKSNSQRVGTKNAFVADIDPLYMYQFYFTIIAFSTEVSNQQKMELLETFYFWR